MFTCKCLTKNLFETHLCTSRTFADISTNFQQALRVDGMNFICRNSSYRHVVSTLKRFKKKRYMMYLVGAFCLSYLSTLFVHLGLAIRLHKFSDVWRARTICIYDFEKVRTVWRQVQFVHQGLHAVILDHLVCIQASRADIFHIFNPAHLGRMGDYEKIRN